MKSSSFARCKVGAAILLSLASSASIAATVSGTVSYPTSDAGYALRTAGSTVRVMGTTIVANVVEADPNTTGTFTLTNVPTGPLTLIIEEPLQHGTVTGDRFTQDSKRVELVVNGDVNGVSFDLVYHWRNLPSYPPPYQNPSYDIWEPYFISPTIGFMGFLNRGVSPFQFELWRTTNGGETWTKIGHWTGDVSTTFPDLAGPSMLFVDADHGLIRGTGLVNSRYYPTGVIRTDDGGQTWTYVDLPNAPPVGQEPGGNGLVNVINFGAIDETHWILCGAENVGSYMGSGTPGWVTIWETADAGATWWIAKTWREDYGTCSALGADPSGKALVFDTPYAFGGSKKLALRDTSGTWSFKEGNALVTNSGYGTADAPMIDGTVWVTGALNDGASSSDPGVYRSLDGGLTWFRISTAQLQYFDFATMLRGFTAAGGPAYASYDGGITWRYQSGGGGICCHGNYMFAFSPTDAFWKDGGVGDPNGKADLQRYFEQASPYLEVLKGTGAGNATVPNGATNVPVAAFSFTSYGLTDLLLQPLHVRASGTGNDRSEIDRVTLWWDRDGDGSVSTGDTAISTTTFGADDGVAELGLGSVPQLHQLYPRQLLVTYDIAQRVRDGVTFSAALEPVTVEAFTDDSAMTRVAATAPTGTVIGGATITAAARMPIPPAIPAQSATEYQSFGYTVPSFTDPNGDPLTYAFSGLPAWLTVCNPSENPRYLCGRPPYSESSLTADKSYTITLTAKDPDQNEASASFTLTVLNVNRLPVPPTSIPDQVVKEGTSYGYTLPAFSEPDGDSLTYEFQGLPGWLTVCYPAQNRRYLCGRPPLTETGPNVTKEYPITVVATDPASAQATKSFRVLVTNNAPPQAPVIPEQSVSEYASYGYTAPAFTDDDASLTYTFSGLPAWLKVCYPTQNPRYLCGRPPYTESTHAANKSYSIGYVARDPAGQTTGTTIALTVLNINRPPVAPASIPGQTATEGQSFGYTAPQFTDPDGDALSYSFAGLPAWLTVCYPTQNPRYLCGRPPFTEASPGVPTVYTILQRATDTAGAFTEQSLTLTVLDAPQ